MSLLAVEEKTEWMVAHKMAEDIDFKQLPSIMNIDTDDSSHFIYFSTGDMARITKTYYEIKDKIRFFLHPSDSMITRLGLKGKEREDKFYWDREDVFIRDIPKNWIIPLSIHPKFQRFLAFCDWNLNYIDPTYSKLREMDIENKRIQSERDSFGEKIKALMRKIDTYSKYDMRTFEKTGKVVADIAKSINPLTSQPITSNQGGEMQ